MSRMCLLSSVLFNNSETLKCLRLVVWGKPSKILEIFQSGLSFFTELDWSSTDAHQSSQKEGKMVPSQQPESNIR